MSIETTQQRPAPVKYGRKVCCCCGEYAGTYKQHWNRDTGYGTCRSCIDDEIARGVTPEELVNLYGIEGVNYQAKIKEGCHVDR